MAFLVSFGAFLAVICGLLCSLVCLDCVAIVMSLMVSVDRGLSDRVNTWDTTVTRRCGIWTSCY